MKNVKISNDIHKQIKQISSQEGMTMDGVLRDLLQVEKAEYQKAEYQKADSPGSNIVQERDTTISTGQVEKAENQKDGYVSRKEFDEALEGLHKWTKKLVEEYMEFCPNCDHLLYLHVQNHTSHNTPKFFSYLKEVGSVYGEGGCYHLECPRCGYWVGLKQPKWWQYKNGEKKVLDLRNAEGRGEDLAD